MYGVDKNRQIEIESVYFESGVDPIIVNAKRKGMIEYEKMMRAKHDDPRRILCERIVSARLKAKGMEREQRMNVKE